MLYILYILYIVVSMLSLYLCHMAMRIKIYIKYGGMLNDDDRQLSTPNYNNINSFFNSSPTFHRTYNKKTMQRRLWKYVSWFVNGTNNNM